MNGIERHRALYVSIGSGCAAGGSTVESCASDVQMEANFSKLATHVSTSSSEWECRWQALKSKVETMEMDAGSLKEDFGDLIESNFKMMHIIAAHPQRSAARERDFKDPHLSF